MSVSIEKFQPQSLAELEKLAAMIAVSQFAPKQMAGKPADCAIAIMMGAEIGLAPLQALQNIAVVNGKPSVYGDAVLALIRASGMCEYFTETMSDDGQVATAKTRRKGETAEEVRSFSIEDAKKAQLWGKQGPWTQYPRRMLQMRARGFLARDVYPDCLKGLITREEAEDYPTTERQAQGVTVTATPPAAPEPPQAPAVPMASPEAQKAIMELVSALGWSGPHASNWLKKHYQVGSRAQLTAEQGDAVKKELNRLIDEKDAAKETTDFPGPENKPEFCGDFTKPAENAGSSVGNPYHGGK